MQAMQRGEDRIAQAGLFVKACEASCVPFQAAATQGAWQDSQDVNLQRNACVGCSMGPGRV